MRSILSTFIILLSLSLLSGCALEGIKVQNTALSGDEEARDSDGDSESPGSQVDPERDFGKHALGTKAFNQVYAGMQALTGISIPTRGNTQFDSIRTFYNATQASLPSSNSLSAFSPTNILAIFNLAYEFCFYIAEEQEPTTIRNNFFSNSIFANANGQVPVIGLNNEVTRNAFVDHLLFKFLGNQVSSLEHRDLMKAELLDLILDLPPNGGGARQIWASVCTAALGGASLSLF